MNFGRLGKWIAIGIIAVVVFTYGVYAMEYQGNYDVAISFSITVPETGEVAITEFEYESEPTGVLSFWELRGKSGAPLTGVYTIYAEWNQSGDLDTFVVPVTLTDIPLSDSSDKTEVSFTFFNKNPGTASLRLYVVFEYVGSIIYDMTYPVVVG